MEGEASEEGEEGGLVAEEREEISTLQLVDILDELHEESGEQQPSLQSTKEICEPPTSPKPESPTSLQPTQGWETAPQQVPQSTQEWETLALSDIPDISELDRVGGPIIEVDTEVESNNSFSLLDQGRVDQEMSETPGHDIEMETQQSRGQLDDNDVVLETQPLILGSQDVTMQSQEQHQPQPKPQPEPEPNPQQVNSSKQQQPLGLVLQLGGGGGATDVAMETQQHQKSRPREDDHQHYNNVDEGLPTPKEQPPEQQQHHAGQQQQCNQQHHQPQVVHYHYHYYYCNHGRGGGGEVFGDETRWDTGPPQQTATRPPDRPPDQHNDQTNTRRAQRRGTVLRFRNSGV